MDSGDRNQNLVCVLLRLTNIYFDYIEALAHVSPTHEDIWTYMNMIRKRAGIPATVKQSICLNRLQRKKSWS